MWWYVAIDFSNFRTLDENWFGDSSPHPLKHDKDEFSWKSPSKVLRAKCVQGRCAKQHDGMVRVFAAGIGFQNQTPMGLSETQPGSCDPRNCNFWEIANMEHFSKCGSVTEKAVNKYRRYLFDIYSKALLHRHLSSTPNAEMSTLWPMGPAKAVVCNAPIWDAAKLLPKAWDLPTSTSCSLCWSIWNQEIWLRLEKPGLKGVSTCFFCCAFGLFLGGTFNGKWCVLVPDVQDAVGLEEMKQDWQAWGPIAQTAIHRGFLRRVGLDIEM